MKKDVIKVFFLMALVVLFIGFSSAVVYDNPNLPRLIPKEAVGGITFDNTTGSVNSSSYWGSYLWTDYNMPNAVFNNPTICRLNQTNNFGANDLITAGKITSGDVEIAGSGARRIRINSTNANTAGVELIRQGAASNDWLMIDSGGSLYFLRSGNDGASWTSTSSSPFYIGYSDGIYTKERLYAWSTNFPVISAERSIASAGAGTYYGANALIIDPVSNPTVPYGVAFYFKGDDSAGTEDYMGLFGGGYYDPTSGSERGELVFGAAIGGADPGAVRHFDIKGISTTNANVTVYGNFSVTNNIGTGNAYACFDANGRLFRSGVACV